MAHAESASSVFVRASRAQLWAFAAAATIAGCDDKAKVEPTPVTNVASENSVVASVTASASAPPVVDAADLGGIDLSALGSLSAKGLGPGMAAAYGGPPPPSGLAGVKGPTGDVATGAATGADVAKLDADAIVARNRSRFKACYQKALAFDPMLDPGKVTVSVNIDADGAVTDAKAAGAALPASLGVCVEGAARLMKFAAPGKTTSIVVPLVFKKKD